MQEGADRYFNQGRGILMLAGAFLLAPFGWFLHQQFSYLLVYWACGGGPVFLFHLGTLLFLLLAAAGAYLAWKAWNHSGRGWADEGGSVADRSRFLAFGGMLLSGLFGLAIVAQWIPTLVVDPCVR